MWFHVNKSKSVSADFIDSAGVTRSISANCIDSAGVSTDCIETVSETVTKKYFGTCLLSTLIIHHNFMDVHKCYGHHRRSDVGQVSIHGCMPYTCTCVMCTYRQTYTAVGRHIPNTIEQDFFMNTNFPIPQHLQKLGLS